MDSFTLPDGLVTTDATLAAESWAAAFYKAKDALQRIRPIPNLILTQKPVRDLDEIIAECDSVLILGDQ